MTRRPLLFLLGAAVLLVAAVVFYAAPDPAPAGALDVGVPLEVDGVRRDLAFDDDVARAPVAAPRAPDTYTEATDVAPTNALREAERRPTHGTLAFLVRDRAGRPSQDARIDATGLRGAGSPALYYRWPGERMYDDSDAEGRVELSYPLAIDVQSPTGGVTATVSHDAFVARTLDCAVDSQPVVVVLERGGTLVVSAWIDSPNETIVEVEPFVTGAVPLSPTAWRTQRDGRLCATTVAPGRHKIYLRHQTTSGAWLFSAVHDVDVAQAEEVELHLRLLPGARLEGSLSDAVPRPVARGYVLLDLRVGGGAGEESLPRVSRAEVDADGRFVFANLPPGAGEVFAACIGWASKPVGIAAGSELAASTREGGDASGRARAQALQPADPARAEPIVIEMEPTATLRVVLRHPAGPPFPGPRSFGSLRVELTVPWRSGPLRYVLAGGYRGLDEPGVLGRPDLPAGEIVYEVVAPPWQATAIDGSRWRAARLAPGETLEVAVDLELRPGS